LTSSADYLTLNTTSEVITSEVSALRWQSSLCSQWH